MAAAPTGSVQYNLNNLFAGDASFRYVSGNLMIGNSQTSGSRLEVWGAALGSTAGNQSEIARFAAANTNGGYVRIYQNRSSAGSDWTTAETRIQARTDTNDQAYISFNTLGQGNGIAFGTGWGVSSAQRMQIDQYGNVSIGTTTVGFPATSRNSVTQNGTGSAFFTQRVNNVDANYLWADGTRSGVTSQVGTFNVTTATSSAIVFAPNNTEHMRIASDGNVGIGTSTVNYDLDVWGKTNLGPVGNVRITGGSATNVLTTDGAGNLSWNPVSALSAIKTYTIYKTAGPSWIKLGTLSPQGANVLLDGRHVRLRIVTSSNAGAWTADANNQTEIEVHFRSSTGAVTGVNGFPGDLTMAVYGGSPTAYEIKVKYNSGATPSFEFFFYQKVTNNGGGSFYLAEYSDTTAWSDSAGNLSSDPGVASATILQAINRVALQSNVLVGTTTTNAKFNVAKPAGASTWPEIWSGDGTQHTQINSNAAAGAYNPMVQAGDHSIIFSNGTIDTGSLMIGQWSASGRGLRIDSNGNVSVGTATTTYKLEVNGSFAATTKSFVIDHPTKTGMKLRYGSLEGPENGVYVRGRSRDAVIELPDYWLALVDPDSITVNLTPIGDCTGLAVESVASDQIRVRHQGGTLDYYFMVLAERCDVDKLEVEF